MRYIYVDEAGTSAKEPVTVVVGIIIEADGHWIKADQMLKELYKKVPEPHREGFKFHAKDVWSRREYRDVWSREDRLNLIREVGQITRRLQLPISLGKFRRDAGWSGLNPDNPDNPEMTMEQWHHIRAFSDCLVRADAFIRERCGMREIATVVVEDIPNMRSKLRDAFKVATVFEIPNYILKTRPTQLEISAGVSTQVPRWKIARIKDGLHFADKNDAPLLQIADACAFSFRRYFSGQDHGADLIESILGFRLVKEDWLGPQSNDLMLPLPMPLR